mgnify:CR=1 FL=1
MRFDNSRCKQLQEKMDFSEDNELLNQFENLNQKTILDQENEIEQLKNELTLRFKIIGEQADIIKRYRNLVKKWQTRKRDQSPDFDIVSEENLKVLPEEVIKSDVVVPKTLKPPAIDISETRSIVKAKRLNDLIDQSQIKYPTYQDHTYKETAIGQAIWDTILKCFQKAPTGIITEEMIVKEGGKHVFATNDEPFLDKKKLQRYFTHPFTYLESDKTMTIRSLITADGPSWLVFLPSWFKT